MTSNLTFTRRRKVRAAIPAPGIAIIAGTDDATAHRFMIGDPDIPPTFPSAAPMRVGTDRDSIAAGRR